MRSPAAARPARRTKALPSWRRRLAAAALAIVLAPPLLFAAYRLVPPLATPLMLIRLAQGYGLDYRWVGLEQMSPSLAKAAVAAEDNLFCEHWGFDTGALRQQVGAAIAGGRPRGASTISMQTAKNLLLWTGRDPVRKLAEAWLTPQLELLVGKRRIIELYLNIAELGPGIYGAEAAARHWFAKPAARLSAEEAARLAAILPSPLTRKPANMGGEARRITTRIRQLGPMLDCVVD
jgi:monofunctional biosynthetic peptidoglycan transglycosylase